MLLIELFTKFNIVPQINLGSNKNTRSVGAMVLNLWIPLGENVLKRITRDYRETNQKYIGLGVAERAESIVIFLSSGVPKPQLHRLSVDHHTGRIVVKHSGDVGSGEGIGCVRGEETGLSNSSISNHNTLDGLHWFGFGGGGGGGGEQNKGMESNYEHENFAETKRAPEFWENEKRLKEVQDKKVGLFV